MKKKLLTALVLGLMVLAAALPAMAADTFAFLEKTITMFEGETASLELLRDGRYADDGDVVFTSANPRILTVDEDGIATALGKGTVKVSASLKRNGKTVKSAVVEIKIQRPVTKVTLSTKNLQIYEAEDETILPLLAPADDEDGLIAERVIVISAGKSAVLTATVTPEDAANKKVTFTTTDAGVARVTGGKNLQAVQGGECDLIVASAQNPEVMEVFHVLVIEPVKKITIEAPFKTMFAGTSMQLDAICSPDTATIQEVTWSSRTPRIATVDADGTVTAYEKGRVIIEARAADGSGAVGTITLTINQDVTDVTLRETRVNVATGRTVQLSATVLPKNADNKAVTWESLDTSIATVRNGQVTGVRAGECTIVCSSASNPSAQAYATVTVVQPVTRITFLNQPGLSIPVRTSLQLEWDVGPEDATIKDVTFSSNATKIATVDQNGVVTGLSRGTATITATATDGSRKQGSYKVTVIQPVEGVALTQEVYYVQRNYRYEEQRSTPVRAKVLPSNANNQKVYWSTGDDTIATARSSGPSSGWITGGYTRQGITTVTVTTEDGGYTAMAEVLVDDFDRAVQAEGAWLDNNVIRMVLRNTSIYTIQKVYFRVECFNTQGAPMICNMDGESTYFEGFYPLELLPDERTIHGRFNYGAYMDTGNIGFVTVYITGYDFENGQHWDIPTELQVPYQSQYSSHMWEPTPTPTSEVPPPLPPIPVQIQEEEEGNG